MQEVWKPIKGYEKYYSISNYGRVKSSYSGKILKPIIEKTGYNQVTLVKDKHKKKHYIHRLVGIHFIENKCSYREINHIDGNKSNNTVINLEWCDRKYNVQHCVNILGKSLGKKSKRVQCIETGKIFNSVKEVSLYYNRHPSNLYNLLNGSSSGNTYANYHWKYI